MNDRITIGEKQVDFLVDTQKIIEVMTSAKIKIDYISQNHSQVYKGMASGEMEQFFLSLNAHTDRLIMFYNKMAEFIMYAFKELKMTDEEQALIIVKILEKRGLLEEVVSEKK